MLVAGPRRSYAPDHQGHPSAAQVELVDRVGVGVLVRVGAAPVDRVLGQEAAGGGVVEPDAHEGQAGERLGGALLGTQPVVAGGVLAGARSAVLVGVQRRGCLAGVQRQLERHVTVDGGELEDDVAGLAGGGGEVPGDRVDVARHGSGGGVLDDPARVVTVAVVVVELGLRPRPAGAAAGLHGPGAEAQGRVELPGLALAVRGLPVDQVVGVVLQGAARQRGGAAEGVVDVARVDEPVGAVVRVGGGGRSRGGAGGAGPGGRGGQGGAVAALVEAVAAPGADLAHGVVDVGQPSGPVVGVLLRRPALVAGDLAVDGLGDRVGEDADAVAVTGVGARDGRARRVLGDGQGVAAGQFLAGDRAVRVVRGGEGARDGVGDPGRQAAGLGGVVVGVGEGGGCGVADPDRAVEQVVLRGGPAAVGVRVGDEPAQLVVGLGDRAGRRRGDLGDVPGDRVVLGGRHGDGLTRVAGDRDGGGAAGAVVLGGDGAGPAVGGLDGLGRLAVVAVLGGGAGQRGRVGAAARDVARRTGPAGQVGPLRAALARAGAVGGPVRGDPGGRVRAGGTGQGLGDHASLGVVAARTGQVQPAGVLDREGGQALGPVVLGLRDPLVAHHRVVVTDPGTRDLQGHLVLDGGGAVGGTALVVLLDRPRPGRNRRARLDQDRGAVLEVLGQVHPAQRAELLQLADPAVVVERGGGQQVGALRRGAGDDAQVRQGVPVRVRGAQGQLTVGGGEFPDCVAEPVVLGGADVPARLGGVHLAAGGVHVVHGGAGVVGPRQGRAVVGGRHRVGGEDRGRVRGRVELTQPAVAEAPIAYGARSPVSGTP
ncbi:hypothetical protein SGLAM104S_03148 [Streptomyces glaucescens]